MFPLNIAKFSILVLIVLMFSVALPSDSTRALDRYETTDGTVYLYNGFEHDTVGSYGPWGHTPEGFDFNDIGPGNVTIIDDPLKAHTGNRYAHHYVPIGEYSAYALFLTRWWTDEKTPLGRPMPYEFPQLYVRWYVKFVYLPANWGDYVKLFYFLYHYENATSGYKNDYGQVGTVTLGYVGGNYSLIFTGLWGATGKSAEVTLNTDQWYCLEVWYKRGTNGEWKLWLDGNLLYSATGIVEPPTNPDPNWAAYAANGFDIGLYGPKDNTAPSALLLDDIVVADYRVGPDWIPAETTTVTLQVFDNETENYVSNASVRMNSYEGYTNGSGFITFTGVPTFSSYTLNISKLGYHRLTKSVSVPERDPNLKFYLQRTSPSKLVIKAYAGSTEITSTVEISDSNGAVAIIETPSNVELNPGTYTLKARYNDQTLTRSMTLLEGQTTSINFEFEKENGGEFESKVVTAASILTIAILGSIVIWKRFRI